VEFEAGTSQTIVLYYYENGGGAWVQLYWNQGNGFEIVPSSAFDVTSPDEELQNSLTETLNVKIEELINLVNQIQVKVEEVISTNENVIIQVQIFYTPTTIPVVPDPEPPVNSVPPQPEITPEPIPVEPEPEPVQEEPEPPTEEPKDPEPEVPQDPEPPLEEKDPKEDLNDKPQPIVPDTNDKGLESPVQGKPQTPSEPASPQNPPSEPPSNTIVLPNGVELPADIAEALELFDNPSEMLALLFTDPGKVLKALLNVGADMSPEKRDIAQKGAIAVIIVTQIVGGMTTMLARGGK
jgi:hypothetical protein